MGHDIRKTEDRPGPRSGAGDGAAYRGGYGAGGLGAGTERNEGDRWDKPGVTPDGHRTGSSTDGPRIPMDGESDPDAVD